MQDLAWIWRDNRLAADMIVNFYLDGDAVERSTIEQALLDRTTKQGQEQEGLRLVQILREIAAERGL